MSDLTAPQSATANLILSEFDIDDQATLIDLVESVYTLYADKARIAPRLQYWYAMRHCLDILLKRIYKKVDEVEEDEQQKLSDQSTNLHKQRVDVQEEIDKLERLARAGRAPVVATLTTTAPEPCRVDMPNPNDSVYRGDPLKPLTTFPR